MTGAAGFFGRALCGLLAGEGRAFVPADLAAGTAAGERCRRCDLGDYTQVRRLLRAARPSEIYHLAGVFSGDYDANYRGNFLPAKNLLDAVLELGLDCRVLLAGSAAEYGAPPKNPVPETAPDRPVNNYGFAKSLQTRLGAFYHRVYGLDVVTARVFNLTGPGVSEALFPGRVARQVEAYRRGEADRIKVGRLDSWRDYLAAPEAAGALALLMRKARPGEIYNVGSGRPVRMRALLEDMLAEGGVPLSAVESAPGAAGRLDVDRIYADTRKFRALAGRR